MCIQTSWALDTQICKLNYCLLRTQMSSCCLQVHCETSRLSFGIRWPILTVWEVTRSFRVTPTSSASKGRRWRKELTALPGKLSRLCFKTSLCFPLGAILCSQTSWIYSNCYSRHTTLLPSKTLRLCKRLRQGKQPHNPGKRHVLPTNQDPWARLTCPLLMYYVNDTISHTSGS